MGFGKDQGGQGKAQMGTHAHHLQDSESVEGGGRRVAPTSARCGALRGRLESQSQWPWRSSRRWPWRRPLAARSEPRPAVRTPGAVPAAAAVSRLARPPRAPGSPASGAPSRAWGQRLPEELAPEPGSPRCGSHSGPGSETGRVPLRYSFLLLEWDYWCVFLF